MNPRRSFLLLALVVGPLAAQVNTDAQREQASRQAFGDAEFANVFIELRITGPQASKIIEPLVLLQRKLAQIDQELTAARQRAAGDLQRKRDALLAGRPLPATALPELAKYEKARAALEQQRDAAYDEGVERVLGMLEAEQRNQVLPPESQEATPEADPAKAAEKAQEYQRRRQLVFNRLRELILLLRDLQPPSRFRTEAPEVIRTAVVEMTGFAGDSDLVNELTAYYYQRIEQLRALKPRDFEQVAPTVCLEMADETLAALSRTPGAGTEASGPKRVTPERIKAALHYDRAIAVMQLLTRRGG